MKRGKQTCRILKEIRRQIAEANDIDFVISECQYKGDCLGTCPKCESEVRYLEQQLAARHSMGKAITVVGMSLGLSTLMAMASNVKECNAGPVVQTSVVQSTNRFVAGDMAEKDAIAVLMDEIEITWMMNDSNNEIIERRRKDLKKEVQEENVLPGVMEQMAEFRDGGMYGLERFLYKNLRWPEGVDENKSGRVLVRFLVDKDGTVKSAEILQTASPEFGNEVLRVINLMPKWAPSILYGIPLATQYTIPVVFNSSK